MDKNLSQRNFNESIWNALLPFQTFGNEQQHPDDGTDNPAYHSR